MKITVKKGASIIIIDEADNDIKDNKTSLRWSDQMQNIHSTIILMVDRCIKCYRSIE